MEKRIKNEIEDSIAVKQKVLEQLMPKIKEFCEKSINAYKNKGRLIFFGNGGSAADAQHLVGELVNKFYFDRPMLDSIALNVNTSVITAIANDSSYDNIFSRQIESLVNKDDIVVGISTSGNSRNVINGLLKAKEKGVTTIGMTGVTGGKMKEIVDLLINVPSDITPRIQEAHMLIGHIVCGIVEKELFGKDFNNE